jgi:outer membrane protein assembly factor BamC
MQTLPHLARPQAVTAVALAATLLLGGCSSLGSLFGRDEPDYRNQAGKTQPLEVPPDLSQLARDSRYRTQTGAPVTASSQQVAGATGAGPAAAAAPNLAATSIGNVRVERQGNQRWLVVPVAPEQLWPRLREFWLESGFTLVVDDPTLGILQTNWAEDRTKIPQDFIRRTFGRLFDFAYSTSERDQFRTRVERIPGGGTEIYITHRGMEEIYTTAQRDNTAWRPRAQDPQIEAEYLSRLMAKLGLREDAARAAVAAAPEQPPRARTVTTAAVPAAAAGSGAVALEIDESFDRAWRRVGLALDRSSFTVEDRDRAAGLYFVRWVDPKTLPKDDESFFSRLFGGSGSGQPQRLRVLVKTEGTKTRVSVLSAQGTPETGDAARSIVAALERELR